MWSFREHLFQVHWRVTTESFTWLNVVAFFLFAVLAGTHLWLLGEACQEGDPRRVRFANGSILAVAALFILLTFHEGDKNHLYALINGVLKFKDIKWYLILNSCFRMPFLAGWLFAYAFIYYAFVRTKREHQMLRVTAIAATIYIIACLRDLMAFGLPLVIVDCFGIACLLPWKRGNVLSLCRTILPLVLISVLFLVFGQFDKRLQVSGWSPEFAIMFWGTSFLFGGLTVYAKVRGFVGPWSRLFPFAFATFLLFITTYFPLAANYRNLLCAGFALPRYFLSAVLVVAATMFAGALYRKWRPGASLWWLDVINVLIVTLSLIDLRLSQIMGVRLDWDVVSLAFGETPKMMWRMAKPYLPSAAGALCLILLIYIVAVHLFKRLDQKKRDANASFLSAPGSWFLLVVWILLACTGRALIQPDKVEGQTLIRLVQTSPLVRNMSRPLLSPAKFRHAAEELGVNFLSGPQSTNSNGTERDLNVVLVFQESTYNKHLSLFGSAEDTQPLLSKYKDRMEIFPNFFSSYTGSINARFATFAALYPVRDYNAFTTRHVPVKSIFEVLNAHGYSCSMFYSSFFEYTGFRDFLRGRGLEEMYDAENMPGERVAPPVSWGLQESETLGAIRQQIKTYATNNQKFFLTYVPAAPHNPFDGTPREFQKYKRERMGDFTPLYRNELLYMDWVLASILDQLKESGVLDHTLVVITADHGEMLGENGGPIGHGWRVTPELQNVPLILMDPAAPHFQINHTVGSQVDVMPTILDKLRIPVPTGEMYEGASLYSQGLNTNRTIYINSYLQWGMIEGNRFICGSREANSGAAAKDSTDVFSITNDGPRTLFVPVPNANAKRSIAPFDRFQDNFLFNYGDYCRTVEGQPSN